MVMTRKGLIHVYYGYGKGKTTTALGLALRASGRDFKVVIVQFLKDTPSGELKQLALLPGVTVIRGKAGRPFVRDMNDAEKSATKQKHDDNLRQAFLHIESGKCDLLILDEALDAYQLGLLDDLMLSNLIQQKPPTLELVITGHKPTDWIIDKADYVTEMVKHKHPYNTGVKARKGIEF
jgi:cob(I)alamin adenosyltransferase